MNPVRKSYIERGIIKERDENSIATRQCSKCEASFESTKEDTRALCGNCEYPLKRQRPSRR